MEIQTLLRCAEHKALSGITLNGSILDLGGDARAQYRTLLGGAHTFTTVNFDEKAQPDVLHDLEEPLPFPDMSFDNVLLMNVLEHIFNYGQLIRESARVVKPGGSVIIVVPFLFPCHPSPSDFWRFSKQALLRECETSGLSIESIGPLGSGVFAARYVMIDRLMPLVLRLLGWYIVRPLVLLADRMFTWLARTSGKKYEPADYALGYCVEARKPST